MGTAEYPTYKTVLEHYGFLKDPFGEVLDPDVFYPASSHIDVLNSLTEGLKRGPYLQVITSEPGVGKTTILRMLHDRVSASEVIFHRQPRLRSWESLKYLLLRLGITSDAEDMEDLQRRLVEVLDEKGKAGVSISLIIDEAQNLGEHVIALLRSLSSKQSGQRTPVKVVLAIQASSGATLPELGLNDERLLELKPFTSEEVGAYIAHRLRRSGSEGQEIFSSDAVRQIAEYTRGVPREINMVCSEALRLCLESGGSTTVEEQCLRQTITLHRNSHEADAIRESNLVEPFRVKADHSAFKPKVLVDELEHWFAQHDHNWTGTRSELLSELQSQVVSSGLSAERREDLDRLLNVLEENLPELEKSGVGVSIKKGVGSPVLITLQHVDPQGETKLSSDVMIDPARLRMEENERIGETKLDDQSSSQTLSSTRGERPTEPTSTDGSAVVTTEEGENDSTESLRRALQVPDTGGHKHRVAYSRRSKLLMVLLVLTLLGLTLIWSRQSLMVGGTQGERRDVRMTSPERATESRDGSSSLSKVIRDAESGDSASQLALATLYQSGDRIERNDAQAVQWLRRAATQGEVEAAYRLANAYRRGQGAPLSKIDAYCWYVIAADAGHTDSEQQIKVLTAELTDRDIANVRYELGQMHLNGTGARPDKLEAYFWFRLAEVAGHPTAIQAQQALASQMTNEQIATAAEKASRWLQVHPPKTATSSQRQAVENSK